MTGLYFLLPTLFIILLSFLIIRVGAIALMITGLEEQRARFQALSAFTGTGFTTHEAESVINHPKRRRIISILMIMGNVGIVAVIVTMTSSIVKTKGYFVSLDILLFVVGIYLIYKFATHKKIIRRWESFIEDKFVKSNIFEEAATEDLLHLFEGYGLVRFIVDEQSPLNGSTLADHKLNIEGILVLGVERGKSWVPVPRSDEVLHKDDRLVIYGPVDKMKSILSQIT
ncbi:MAG TPA: TrkA C-terminal domain-containing protein [Desulfatiglandales bacterium]|nr:TrkA C-terminal domain-containing protein [Desulfatiglandales bacterium]